MSNEWHNIFHGIWKGIAGTPWYTWVIAIVLILGIGFLIWDSNHTPKRFK